MHQSETHVTPSPLVFPYFRNRGHTNKLQYCYDGVGKLLLTAFRIACS